MNKEWLRRRLTIEQAEAEHMVTNAKLGPDPVPFGFSNKDWTDLISKMQLGDELWEYNIDYGFMDAEGGIAVVRGGDVVAQMMTWLS
jgi:hypothetical protein